MIALVMIVVFIFMLLGGLPVAFAMGLSSLTVLLLSGQKLEVIPQMIAQGVQTFPLMAVPFYILVGTIMNSTGLTRRVFEFALSLVGHFKGGLGHVNVLASMIFAGMSGSKAADDVGLGLIEINSMQDEGYDLAFSAAITNASSIVGPIIPPSIMMVVYAVGANVSVLGMFLAGILPGIVIGISLMVMVYYLAASKKVTCPSRPRASIKYIWKTFLGGFLAVITPIIILISLSTGFTTPTEGGVVAVVWAVCISVIYGERNPKTYLKPIKEAVILSGQVMFLFGSATLFGWVVVSTRIPMIVADSITNFSTNPHLVMLLLIIFYTILGCFLESMAGMIITLPVVLPIIQQVGIDPTHFGIVMIFNMLIGSMTPPMGAGLYLMMSICPVRFEDLLRATKPFFIILMVALLILAYVPQISLFLPNLIMK